MANESQYNSKKYPPVKQDGKFTGANGVTRPISGSTAYKADFKITLSSHNTEELNKIKDSTTTLKLNQSEESLRAVKAKIGSRTNIEYTSESFNKEMAGQPSGKGTKFAGPEHKANAGASRTSDGSLMIRFQENNKGVPFSVPNRLGTGSNPQEFFKLEDLVDRDKFINLAETIRKGYEIQLKQGSSGLRNPEQVLTKEFNARMELLLAARATLVEVSKEFSVEQEVEKYVEPVLKEEPKSEPTKSEPTKPEPTKPEPVQPTTTIFKEYDDTELRNRIEGLEKALKEKTTEISVLNVSLSKANTEITNSNAYIKSLENRFNKFEAQVEEDKAKTDDKIQKLEGRINTLEGKVTTLEGKVTTLEAKNVELTNNFNKLQNRFNTLENKTDIKINQFTTNINNQFETFKTQSEQKIDKLKEENTDLKTKFTNFENTTQTTINQFTTNINEINNKFDVLKQQNDDLKKDNERLKSENDALKGKSEELETKVEELLRRGTQEKPETKVAATSTDTKDLGESTFSKLKSTSETGTDAEDLVGKPAEDKSKIVINDEDLGKKPIGSNLTKREFEEIELRLNEGTDIKAPGEDFKGGKNTFKFEGFEVNAVNAEGEIKPRDTFDAADFTDKAKFDALKRSVEDAYKDEKGKVSKDGQAKLTELEKCKTVAEKHQVTATDPDQANIHQQINKDGTVSRKVELKEGEAYIAKNQDGERLCAGKREGTENPNPEPYIEKTDGTKLYYSEDSKVFLQELKDKFPEEKKLSFYDREGNKVQIISGKAYGEDGQELSSVKQPNTKSVDSKATTGNETKISGNVVAQKVEPPSNPSLDNIAFNLNDNDLDSSISGSKTFVSSDDRSVRSPEEVTITVTNLKSAAGKVPTESASKAPEGLSAEVSNGNEPKLNTATVSNSNVTTRVNISKTGKSAVNVAGNSDEVTVKINHVETLQANRAASASKGSVGGPAA